MAKGERLVAVADVVVEEHVHVHAMAGVGHAGVEPDRVVVVDAQKVPAPAQKPWSTKVTWMRTPASVRAGKSEGRCADEPAPALKP